MHDETAEGNDYFKCDFCHQPWSDDRPMVEGHKGSLICSKCLTTAYVQVVHQRTGVEGVAGPLADTPAPGPACIMCRERRGELYWQSPLFDDAHVCKRCIRQSAATLEHDPDYGYQRPKAPEAASDAGAE